MTGKSVGLISKESGAESQPGQKMLSDEISQLGLGCQHNRPARNCEGGAGCIAGQEAGPGTPNDGLLVSPRRIVNPGARPLPFEEMPFSQRARPLPGLLLGIFAIHLLMIYLLGSLWQSPKFPLKPASAPRINSYLYTAPGVTRMPGEDFTDGLIEPELGSAAEIITGNRPEPNTHGHAPSSKSSNLQKPTQAEPVPVSEPLQRPSDSRASRVEEVSQPANISAVERFTRYYLRRHNERAFDDLLQAQASQYTSKRSMSEMDGDLKELVFSQLDEYSQVKTHQHRLDPNRIVKKGDTCYRVVKLATQLNPHAENLGYPFDCGGDRVKKAIHDAINARLDNSLLGKGK